MPTTVLITPPDAAAEPLSLALVKAHVRVDGDGEDEYLQLLLSAAREKVEAYTGRYFAAQTLAITYELGEGYALPAGGVATAVSGVFTTLEELANASTYLEEYRKGISISRDLPFGVALQQTFTVTVQIGGADNALQVPSLAKAAILELVGEWYRNRETTVAGVAVISELPVSWKVKLAPLRTSIYG